MTIKKRVTAFVFVLCLAFSQLAYAGGIPVFDAVQEANAIQQLTQMIQQLQQMKEQYNKLEDTYNAMTGARPDFGSILNDNKYRSYIPEDYRTAYDTIREQGTTSEVTGAARKAGIDLDVMCKGLTIPQQAACKKQVSVAVQDNIFSKKAYESARSRYDRIKELVNKISGTTDQKAILELNARIQAEQAMILNEALKLQIYRMVVESERRVNEQSARSANLQSMMESGSGKNDTSNLSGRRVEPINFR